MGVELRLFGGNDCLLIEQHDDEDWYYCTLLVATRRFYLGAEVARCLFPRLLAAVSGELHGPTSRLGDVEVRSALSLAEGHATLYVGTEAGDTLLFWEDEDGELTAMLKLGVDDLEQWRRQLETFAALRQLERGL